MSGAYITAIAPIYKAIFVTARRYERRYPPRAEIMKKEKK